MPPYGEPDWASPGDTSNVATTQAGLPSAPASSGAGATNTNSADERAQARCITTALSLFNMGIAAMMGALGLIAIVKYNPKGFDDLTQIFLSAYMVIFATLLFSYELIFWTSIPKLNIMYRKNFGFLYGLKGKGLFLIFIAFLTLGMMDDGTASTVKGLDWATGIAWLAGGFLHVFVSCTMPEVNLAYKPPTAGLSTLGHQSSEVGGTPNPV